MSGKTIFESTQFCTNHDGAQIPVAVTIEIRGTDHGTSKFARCLYCAEGFQAYLNMRGVAYSVEPVDSD